MVSTEGFDRWCKRYLCFAAVLLFVTAGAKIVSFFGHARILEMSDPLIGIPMRWLILLVGFLEIGVAGVLVSKGHFSTKLTAIATLSTCFLTYRLGLLWAGVGKPCACLGNIGDILRIPPNVIDISMKSSLAYLLIGSLSFLLVDWLRGFSNHETLSEKMA